MKFGPCLVSTLCDK